MNIYCIWRKSWTSILTMLLAFYIVSLPPLTKTARAEFPDKHISLIVPFPAGGRSDLGARILAEAIGNSLGQAVNVENRPGAGGVIGARYVADAAPDGYTLLTTSAALIISSYTMENSRGLDDFESLAIVEESQPVLVIQSNSEWQNIGDLIAASRSNPGEVAIGNIPGATSQVVAAGFVEAAKIDVVTVPFKGDADAVIALAGGNIDFYICGVSSAKPLIAGGKLRVLAVAGNRRLADFPDVPLMKEEGIDFVASLFNAVFAPKNTPERVLDKLEGAIATALQDREVLTKIKNAGLNPVYLDQEATSAFLASENSFYEKMTKKLGLQR